MNGNGQTFSGNYVGILPCADCKGVKTIIKFDNGNYSKDTEYFGKKEDNKFVEKGTIKLNEDKTILTLIPEDAPDITTSYKVGEESIIQLDNENKQYTGEDSIKYVLQRIDL